MKEGVKFINEYAFSYCTSLDTLTLSEGIESIDQYAFQNCTSLTKVTIPSSVTYISQNVFKDCTSLETVTFKEGSKITSLSPYLFYGCQKLSKVELAEGLKEICYLAFKGCTALTAIEIPDSVTTVSTDSFAGTGIYDNADNWDASGVLYVDGWLIVPKEKIKGEYEIKEGTRGIAMRAFYQNTGLTKITFPKGLKYIGDSAFEGCTGLTEITIPEGTVSIGNYAFLMCSNIAKITLPSTLTDIGYLAFDSTKCWVDSYYAGNGIIYFDDYLISAGSAKESNIEVKPGTKVIAGGAFSQYDSSNTTLKSVTIPDSVTAIGDRAFEDCTNLTQINFAEGSNLKTIGEYAFIYCDSLETINIPASVTNLGYGLFYNDNAIKEVNVESGNENYKSIDGVLFNKDGTELIFYPDGKTDSSYTIPNGVKTIDANAFYGCENLTKLTIPASVEYIGYDAFTNCKNIKDLCYLGTEEQSYKIYFEGYDSDSDCTAYYAIRYAGDTEHTHTGGKATCTEDGVCSECGTKYLTATGHDLQTTTKSATFFKDGLKTTKCVHEGCTFVETEVLPSTIHRILNWFKNIFKFAF